MLEKAFPRADRITIYRTLKTFEEKGIVHGIEEGTTEVKYALCQEIVVRKDIWIIIPIFIVINVVPSVVWKRW